MSHSWDSILSEIKNKTYRPIYFLMGAEAYFIDQVVDAIENTVLEESEKAFNQTILYGKDTDMLTVVSEAKRYPMMAPYHVVIVKEAQYLKTYEPLEDYLKNPSPTTILVFAHKHKILDRRKKAGKLLSKDHVMLEAKSLYENQITAWIEKQVKKAGYFIDETSSHLLANHVGSDLGRLNNELNKLFGLLQSGTQITPSLIEQNIGISKDFNTFELSNAVCRKDLPKAFTILRYFEQNPKAGPDVLIISGLYFLFIKICLINGSKGVDQAAIPKLIGVSPFVARNYILGAKNYPLAKSLRVIKYLREYDAKLKGMGSGSTKKSELLKELIIKILY